MSEKDDLIIAQIAHLPREQFYRLVKTLSDDALNYLLREMKSYRDRYPGILGNITHFN